MPSTLADSKWAIPGLDVLKSRRARGLHARRGFPPQRGKTFLCPTGIKPEMVKWLTRWKWMGDGHVFFCIGTLLLITYKIVLY